MHDRSPMNDKIEIDPAYFGPSDLVTDINTALQTLSECLSIVRDECATHSVIVVQGFDDNEVLEATAVYLVSAISQNIDANMQIREALFEEESISRELGRDVISVIGEHDVDDEFKKMNRDPWMWEGISHMLIHLSQLDSDFHPIGQVLAKTSIKYDVHDHGLDVIAIYDSGTLGITAGECKAYFENSGLIIRWATRCPQKIKKKELKSKIDRQRELGLRIDIAPTKTILKKGSTDRAWLIHTLNLLKKQISKPGGPETTSPRKLSISKTAKTNSASEGLPKTTVSRVRHSKIG